MSVPIIFRDVDFHQYTIDPDCTIYKNNEIVPIEDIIYHSTNGYDYVLLETLDHQPKLYRLEFIMVSSFNPGIQNKWEHFKVNHIDGDIKNCHIDNLTFEEDVEEWRIVEYPETVKRNMYAVSSWGRVKSISKSILLFQHISRYGYPTVRLVCVNKENNVTRRDFMIHRLIMLNLCSTNIEDIVVNHIDSIKTNNNITNLEWVQQSDNVKHAKLSGAVFKKSNITTAEIDMIVELLLDKKYNHSQLDVYAAIDHDVYPNITTSVIDHIKQKSRTYFRSDAKYDLQRIRFPKCIKPSSTKITVSEFDMIIELLMDPKYCGSPKKVYQVIDHLNHPNITEKIVSNIKCKSVNNRIGSKYDINNVTFPACRKSSKK